MKYLTTALLLLLLAVPAAAAPSAGTIMGYEGKVLIYRGGAVRGERVKVERAPLYVGDKLRTRSGSTAFVSLVDGSRVVLTPDSTMTIAGLEKMGVEGGRVLFDIKKRGGARGVEITTATALIGVKGTRFAVDCGKKRTAIHLRQGQLQIDAVEGNFRRHYRSMQEEFEQELESMRSEFDQSRTAMQEQFEKEMEQMQQGNIELMENFLMEAGESVAISGQDVAGISLPHNLQRQFDLLDQF